jgi:hypothetical protein
MSENVAQTESGDLRHAYDAIADELDRVRK